MGASHSTCLHPSPDAEEKSSWASSFSPEEQEQLRNLHAACLAEASCFSETFHLPELPWFPAAFQKALGLRDLAKGSCMNEFGAGIAACCRAKRSDTLLVLYRVGTSTSKEMGAEELASVLEAAFVMAHEAWGRDLPARKFSADRLVASAMDSAGGASTLSFDQFHDWSLQQAPLLCQCCSTWVVTRCFPGRSFTDADQSFCPPRLTERSVILEHYMAEAFGMALSQKAMQGSWVMIFTSEEDGLSFNRLCHGILGYVGRTILLVRTTAGGVFGGLSVAPWKESNHFFGSDGAVFAWSPSFRVCTPKLPNNGAFQYLNLKSFELPHGLGFGGSTENFRLFISETLEAEECVARSSCLTFERGKICESPTFEVDVLEVWGVGGERWMDG
ncbi:unnamed protein product [Chrysoparadoxa australica]